jgi:xanthine dehydrogenase small subunit
LKTQKHIEFVLDSKCHTVDFVKQGISPTITVLNYLRSLSSHKGVKEGCAEGDCGACTIVIAEINTKGKLTYKALNSCLIFLPQIHGKQLITVENLAIKINGETQLHPVQKAMVELNGCQCGFCTPGIIMSMFALYKNLETPDQPEIEDGLTGNLCRCTGYAPILKATTFAIEQKVPDQFSEKETETIAQLNSIHNQSKCLEIITSDQKFFQPQTLEDIFIFLERYPESNIVNGSTDIALKQTRKFEVIESIIDISYVSELKNIEQTEKGFNIGSGVSLEDIRTKIAKQIPALKQMLDIFASRQIREIATLGGNIGTASPIGDTIPILFALNATLIIVSRNAQTEINIEDFITGYRKTDLIKGEVIKSVFIPKQKNVQVKFYKVSKRKDLDISTVSAGFRIMLSNDKVTDICLAYGGMAAMPKRAQETENFLIRNTWNRETINKAMEILYNEFSPLSDARSGKEFRKQAAKNLLLKFYNETTND